MERLLSRRVSINLSGQPTQLSVMEAIVMQLLQKGISGNARAGRTLLKYQEFANRRPDAAAELRFVESEYTRAVAQSHSEGGDD